MANLNTRLLRSVHVVLPSIPLLQASEDVIARTAKQRSHNASTAEALATLRDTRLPRTISREVRMPAPTTMEVAA